MSNLKKLREGEALAQIPGRTWNALVAGEERDRQKGPPNGRGPEGGDAGDVPSPVRIAILNDSGGLVPTGGILKITAPIAEAANDVATVYDQLTFIGDTPAVNEQHVAICAEPIANGAIGYAVIPGAAWAKVNVSNAGHAFAAPKASVDELQSSDSNGFPIIWKESGTGAGKWAVIKLVRDIVINVYEFRNCEDGFRTLFLDNPEIATHDPGEVAVIVRDGVYDCWRLIGPAPFCKTGECAIIVAWGTNCDACSVCFYLTPCGGGSPTFVRGVEWYDYEGRVVRLNGPGHEGCYSVAVADGCFDVNEDLNVSHIVEEYNNCDQCGCYELENCADAADIIWVGNDLASFLSEPSGAAAVGRFIKKDGVCYEITGFANPCGVTPIYWPINLLLCSFDTGLPGCPQPIESCNGCCWLLTPCPGQIGDPQPAYYRLQSDDPDLTAFIDEATGESNGRVIRLAGICYTVSIPETCPEMDVILGLPTVEEEYDECADCITSCWERCDAAGTYLKTYSDLSDVGPNASVKRAENGFCYKRATLSLCDGDPIVVFTIETIIDEGVDSCAICMDPRVKLTPSCGSGCGDCSGSSSGGSGSGASTIVTDNAAFFEHIGKYIKMDGVCRLVEWTTDSLSGTVGCWAGPFTSCEACSAAPSQITVIALIGGVHKNVKLQGVFNICGETALDECEV